MNAVLHSITDHQQSNVMAFPVDESLRHEITRELIEQRADVNIHDLTDGIMAAEAVFRETGKRDVALKAGYAIALRRVA
jgi:hypothetical protein